MSGFKTCRHNYDSLMEHLFGKVGIYTYFLFTFLYAYGADVAYIIIMSTNITAVINGLGASDAKAGFADDSIRRIVVACMAVFCVLPLALYRDMVSSISPHVHICSILIRWELTLMSPCPLSIAFESHRLFPSWPTPLLWWSSLPTVQSLPKMQTEMDLTKTSHLQQTKTE